MSPACAWPTRSRKPMPLASATKDPGSSWTPTMPRSAGSTAVLLAEARGLEAGLDTLLTALPWAGSRYCPPQAEEAGDGLRVFQRGVAYFK